ncbi:MAG: hypothetical protein KKC79_02225, partial [Gammaproteobacteria bacterium]|nr:hypothetical protein [Gammaproteobacteria bacterium]
MFAALVLVMLTGQIHDNKEEVPMLWARAAGPEPEAFSLAIRVPSRSCGFAAAVRGRAAAAESVPASSRTYAKMYGHI